VERLCSSFGVALRYIGSDAPRENNQWMVSRDWAEQGIHECIVASPCRFCPALNLGLRAISLSVEGERPSQRQARHPLKQQHQPQRNHCIVDVATAPCLA
jgi:hypothetical protein